ncbi:hypothetical protein [Aquimarina pacifica]|uniref:hypothetical protein n=1 Tax=Aquimarina pacifica TaxID=1296415 RepID=UPI0004B6B259|nr:hypothetical protein [Aquimarina pacifica]
MKSRKSIIKLSIFGLILLITTISIRQIISVSTTNNNLSSFDEIINVLSNPTQDTTYYFIGSSRVQRSINPEIIKKYFKGIDFQNLGISGSTFLGNCILSEHLLKKESPKVLFIELSPIKPKLSQHFIHFSTKANLNIFESINTFNSTNSQEQLLFNLNILNDYLFSRVSLKHDGRDLMQLNKSKKKSTIGFISTDENSHNSILPFLKYEDLETTKYKNENIDIYLKYMSYLEALSKQTNSRVIFFLPVTYKKEKEKNLLIPIYNKLPNHLKLKYSEDFFQEITNSSYLLDKNHFNSKGAEKYTSLLCPIIKSHLLK